ncbi:MAG: BACON domain-containing protein [Thermoanaerobaculaceae bacterium]|mgnify:CR=1 FL=1|nr:BACON domain-containing protein [Thermoanaerobaculaceae bacterium]MDI9623204.1 hypothetical protein [Acidobacteriota bacterium]NLH10640.1 BACON domain-containing protein [Holophagae bacterium]HPW56073.1 hypothetical protein [Thermoanaerobaculaceae bacterium]
MAHAMRLAFGLALLASGAGAQERFAVFEFFVRGQGAYCQAAAPAVRMLQTEMAGRAVLLEYAYDSFPYGRVERWWAAYSGSPYVYLPLVMVGSGLVVDQGPVDYYNRYKAMLDAELARPPQALVRAWSHRQGNSLQVFARATNLASIPLTTDHAAGFWVVVWEDNPVGLTTTWVRATAASLLNATLPPGATAVATVNVPPLGAVDWGRLRTLVLLEHRPAGAPGRYDMLEATIAVPVGLEVSPSALALGQASPEAVVTLDGPHLLSWTATPDVPWLRAQPGSGSLPSTCTVSLDGTPPTGQTGLVHFAATGGGMTFNAAVTVTAQGRTMRIRRHLTRPTPLAGGPTTP